MSILRRTFCFSLVAATLLITAHRLPAPISEIPESPTPAPKQSARPKPKRTIKPKITNENSESSTKVKTSSPAPQSKATPQRNLLDGTWSGKLNDIQFTAAISGSATIVRETSTDGTFTWNATYDGRTMRWNWHRPLLSGASTATVIDSNGKTALVTSTSGGAPLLLGAGAHNTSAVFYKISP
jgi:hypothetical protein